MEEEEEDAGEEVEREEDTLFVGSKQMEEGRSKEGSMNKVDVLMHEPQSPLCHGHDENSMRSSWATIWRNRRIYPSFRGGFGKGAAWKVQRGLLRLGFVQHSILDYDAHQTLLSILYGL